MSWSDAELFERQTEHGLLIAFGEFAQHTGLIAGLMNVRIPQKIQRQARAVLPQTIGHKLRFFCICQGRNQFQR